MDSKSDFSGRKKAGNRVFLKKSSIDIQWFKCSVWIYSIINILHSCSLHSNYGCVMKKKKTMERPEIRTGRGDNRDKPFGSILLPAALPEELKEWNDSSRGSSILSSSKIIVSFNPRNLSYLSLTPSGGTSYPWYISAPPRAKKQGLFEPEHPTTAGSSLHSPPSLLGDTKRQRWHPIKTKQ